MTAFHPAWRRSLPLLGLLLAAILLIYGQTGLSMVEIWDRSGTFAHAWVVPPISLWLIWRQRAALAVLAPQPAPWVLLPFAGMALLWLLGDMAAVNSLAQFAFTAMLVLAVPAVLGWPVARQIAFPLGFLFFCVPAGEFMMPQLMEWTADFTVAAVRLSGVPVYREGLQFIIPSGSWSVVEACSGLRYLIASVMVGTLFAYLNYSSTKRRWIFVGVAAILPLAANWVRAYMIVMLGHLSDNRIATGVDHLIYGWVFFGIVMLALFLIGARWAEPDPAPVPRRALESAPERATGRAYVLGLMALLIVAPPLFAHRIKGTQPAGLPALAAPELMAQGWLPSTLPVANFKPAFDGPAAAFQGSFRKGAAAGVGLYVAYYRHQDYQSKLISSDNVLVRADDRDWSAISHGSITAGELEFRTTRLRGSPLGTSAGGARLSAAQSYWINGVWTPSDLRAKAQGLWERLAGRGDDAAVVILYADDEAALVEFLRDNRPSLDAWLKAVRGTSLGDNPTTR